MNVYDVRKITAEKASVKGAIGKKIAVLKMADLDIMFDEKGVENIHHFCRTANEGDSTTITVHFTFHSPLLLATMKHEGILELMIPQPSSSPTYNLPAEHMKKMAEEMAKELGIQLPICT